MKNLEVLVKPFKIHEKKDFRNLFINDAVFKCTISEILSSQYSSSEKYQALFNLAWIVLTKRDKPEKGNIDTYFVPSKFQIDYQLFIYSWSRFHWKSIPFFEWEDLYNEGVNILTALINENNLENFENDERYKKFTETRRQRQLALMDKYDSLYEYSI